MRALFVSKNLIGDALYIGPALRAWLINNLQNNTEVFIQTLPDHVAPLYVGMVRDIPEKTGYNFEFKTVYERPEGTFDLEFNFDVSKAFELCTRNKYHLAEGYAEMLGVQLPTYPADQYNSPGSFTKKALKPIYIPDKEASEWVGPDLEGCILISMFSASCQSRDAKTKGLPPNKMLPWHKWRPLLKLLRETFPTTPIRFLGAPTDVLPEELKFDPLASAMFGIPLNRLALIMQKAKLLVTIDNGMSHLAASQETPTFLMYPRCLGPHYICPVGNPNLHWVHMEPTAINPAQLVYSLRFAINKFKAKEAA
jgi:hypothetical protein